MVCEGNRLPDDITCLAVDQSFTFAACGKDIYGFSRGKQVSTQPYYCWLYAKTVLLLQALPVTTLYP